MDTTIPKSDISVIVPVYNGGEKFRKCLTSLSTCLPKPKEIIVVVDGATDSSRQIAEVFPVHVVNHLTPQGPAAARNKGAKAATGRILFFVDADVTVLPDAMDRVANTFNKDPELTACFGSYDDDPFEINFLSQFKNLFHHYHHQTASAEAFTFWGACGAIKRDVFLMMNGFDERYKRPSVEDIELGYRLKTSGYRIKLINDLQVKHLKRWDILSLLLSDIVDRALPWTELIWKKQSLHNDLNLKYSNRISIGITYGFVCSLFLGAWYPAIYMLSAVSCALLFLINVKLYAFFYKKRGVWFAAKSVLWHWLYYLYCGVGFALGSALYFVRPFDSVNVVKDVPENGRKDGEGNKEMGG